MRRLDGQSHVGAPPADGVAWQLRTLEPDREAINMREDWQNWDMKKLSSVIEGLGFVMMESWC
jgi:hypothetical protein